MADCVATQYIEIDISVDKSDISVNSIAGRRICCYSPAMNKVAARKPMPKP
jgi:hypothetical protein